MILRICTVPYARVHAQSLSRVSVTLWTVAHQAPLTMEPSKQEYWSWLSFPPPGALPDPGMEPRILVTCTGRVILYR